MGKVFTMVFVLMYFPVNIFSASILVSDCPLRHATKACLDCHNGDGAEYSGII